MAAMDHQTFHAMEIDALYEELDAPGAAAIREHAASCPECATRFERLRVARQRGLSVLVEAVPANFESRIMAAVDAALAKRAGAQVIPMHAGHPYAGAPTAPPGAPPQAPPPGTQSAGAKVIPFFARPSFAVAATLILVIGAAALVTQTSMSRKSASAPMAMDESSPAASAIAASPSPAPNAPVVAAATVAAEPPMGAVALNERGAAALNDPGRPPSPMAIAKSEVPAAKPAKSRTAGGAPEPQSAFDAAVSLFDAGRFPEALPRFEALKASNPEAELYAARCLLRIKGCGAATAARFDTAAQRNSGTETGSRARIEGAKCYQQMGQAQAARSRYQAAENEGFLASEAKQDREALDQQPAATSPGTPAAGTKASPKAPAPTLK